MAEHEPPEEVRQLFQGFDERMKEHLANLDDFKSAIDSGGTADEIVDDWEARRLLRLMPPDSPIQ